ncbi:hypothetical protein GQ53DRAFT_861431 [Thozetella sp. PMI_491]|nr:hypothetical protein GQ53DRAFT_861431 [Thozetella sp. PMI_491]
MSLQAANRARVACKLCNSRRVRCDRSELSTTCSNCQLAGAACELIVSRRGKHKRGNAGRRQSDAFATPPVSVAAQPSWRAEAVGSQMSRRSESESRRYVSPSLSEIALHKDPGSASDKVIYMGDSANFGYAIHEVGDPFRGAAQNKLWGDNLQRFMTEQLGPATQSILRTLDSEQEERLKAQGVFRRPDKDIQDALIRVFLEYVHPACPIFCPSELLDQYETGSLSLLVLNAVFFMAVLYCSDSVLESLGFSSRYLASLTFYRHAKALHDAGYETDGIATLQATIIISHRCDGPMEQKDTYHWLGIAAGLAQSLGMHRTKSYSILPSQRQLVWRRIWWVLFINDIHHAAIYGRPPHISLDFCDIKTLSEDDFRDCSRDNTDGTAPGSSKESQLYLVHFADLAMRAAKCIIAKYSSSSDDVGAKQRRYQELLDFNSSLTPGFSTLPSDITLTHGFWPSLILLYYLEYQVVFYRLLSERPENAILFGLAGKITRLLEDLLASGMLPRAPFQLFPAIFASTLIHIIQLRKGDAHIAVLCEHRIRLALHILETLQDSWPHVLYTRHFLDCLFQSSPGQGSEGARRETIHVQSIEHEGASRNPGTQRGDSTPLSRHGEVLVDGLLSPSCMDDDQPRYAQDSFLVSAMPMFPFDNLAEDVGLSPDFWAFNQNVNAPF